ncbi:hypothetical protein DU53_02565 [Kosmotoga sp. DU53]|nr:hypothetical protein DU53_02565 [Kosmotoga sp. DU53]
MYHAYGGLDYVFSASVSYQPWLGRSLTEIVILNLIQDLVVKRHRFWIEDFQNDSGGLRFWIEDFQNDSGR